MLTGITDAISESLNRLAKLKACQAYEFCNPVNQCRPRPHRLHPRIPPPVTHRNHHSDANGSRTELDVG